ncbi:MAG: intermediate filament protein [uncultured bacterium]|nr:MAG: intermediate filament protein [uncultured bacterium]
MIRYLLFGFTFVVFLTNLSCAGTPSRKIETSNEIDVKKGNSLFYYLVSNIEASKGSEQNSFFYLNKAVKKDAGSTHLLLQKAYQLARNNKLEEAQKLAHGAIQKNPDNPDAYILLGKIAISLGNSNEALQNLKKAIALDPQNEEAYLLLARQQDAMRLVDDAIQTITRLTQINPESLAAYYLLGNFYASEKKNYDLAIKTYYAILNNNPDEFKAWQLIAEIELAKKDYKKALEALLKVKELNPFDINTQIRIALLYYELKDKGNAIISFESILSNNPEADKIQYYLGLLYLDKEDFDKATHYFSLVKPASNYYEDAVTRQIAILIRQKKNSEALILADNILKKNKANKTFFELLASIYALNENYDAALKVLNDALKVFPRNEELLFSQSVLLEKMGQWEKSLEVMKEVLKINGNNVQALNFIGYTLAEKGEDLDIAKSMIEQALQLKPDDGYILDSLGWVYFQKGDTLKALEIISRSNKLAPGEPTILEHLGTTYLKLGNKIQARTYLEKSIFILNEKQPKSKKEEEQIENIRKKLSDL